MMRRKLLHRMKEVCGATRLYDGRTDSGKTSSGRNPAFNLYLYIYLYIDV